MVKTKKEKLAEEDEKLEVEKEHSEPDSDNAGGPSDNDADNKCKKSESEEEEDEEEKKKKLKKAGLEESPEEDTNAATRESNTTTPGAVIGVKQNVFVPQSSINVSREQAVMGKSATVDLTKSPLFVNITKQMDDMQDTLAKKMDAMEKSVNDRLTNIKKDMEKVEKFYSQSFHKAISEEVGPEAIKPMTLTKQMAEGKVMYRN